MVNYILGLDIGIGSVGIGLIEKETGKVIHASSMIFSSANPANNKERRNKRGLRRLPRRRKVRIKSTKKLFEANEIDLNFKNIPINLNPYKIRVRALREKVSLTELFIALRNMVKHRGISYLDDAEDSGVNSGSAYKKAIDFNLQQLKDKTPGEIQLERLELYGQLRGDFSVKDDEGNERRIINVFSTSEYKKEAERILKNQQNYYSEITDEFIEDYLKILTRKRKYYEGPGNEKSRTDYGRFRTNGETLDNIFSILIGKCTFYPDEYRAAKASYSAQEFNLLNDLNNLTVPTETKKLSTEQKEEIIEFVKNSTAVGASKILSKIAKMLDCKADEIRGFRIDKDDKPEMHTFEIYRKMRHLETIDLDSLTREQLDILGRILTLNTDKEGIQEALQHYLPELFSQEQTDELILFRKKNSSVFNQGWHSFSLKLLIELIPELYATSEEQMTILTRLGKQKVRKDSPKTVYIDGKAITDKIYNPVVAKAVRQSIKAFNHIISKYGMPDTVVIEMAREIKDKDKDKIQKRNKDEKNLAMSIAALEYNQSKELPATVFHGHKNLPLKIRLWYQQDKRCAYTGRIIPISKLIHNEGHYEIDHILPLSVSFYNGLENKVLVESTANQEKGQKTPYQAIPTLTNSWNWTDFKKYVLGNKKFSNKKKEFLLFEEDINKYEVRSKFIARNLVDTRYASRVVLNTLQDFFKQKNSGTKVTVVRGLFTAQLRRNWKIEKTRDTYHHHAVDALIIAASSQLRLWEKSTNLLMNYHESELVDSETGEIIPDSEYKELVYQPPYADFDKTLQSKELEESILFSYQQDSKVNRKVSDATIYSTRKIDGVEKTVSKTGDIYTVEGYQKFIKNYKKDPNIFLMAQHDPRTFKEIIEVILKTYPNKEINESGKEVDVSPFKKYYDEHGYVRKYSKKGNGPIIRELKYLDTTVGKCIKITPKNSTRKVILQSLNPWRTDVYFNKEKGVYEFVGLKYIDFRYEKGGNYEINEIKYKKICKDAGISENSEFKFSLYKNNVILIKDVENKSQKLFRFLSSTGKVKEKHKVELKPFEKSNFSKGEQLNFIWNLPPSSSQLQIKLNLPNISIYKIETDVLGNRFIIKKEGDEPKLSF